MGDREGVVFKSDSFYKGSLTPHPADSQQLRFAIDCLLQSG